MTGPASGPPAGPRQAGVTRAAARAYVRGLQSWAAARNTLIKPPNKRMDQSWRGEAIVAGWHHQRCPGKFSTSSRATLVMRGVSWPTDNGIVSLSDLLSRDVLALLRSVIRGDYPVSTVEGLEIHDHRADAQHDHDQVVAVFSEAAGFLGEHNQEFIALVRTNIHQIRVWDFPGDRISRVGRVFSTSLPIVLRRSTFYLACRLIWTAAYFDALAGIPRVLRPIAKRAARRAARHTWLAFVDQFPERAQEWRLYLELHPE